MVFKCLLGASRLNATGSKPARTQHRWAARWPGGKCPEHLVSAVGSPAPQPAPTCTGRAAANCLGGRTLCPSPSPPAACSEGISPFSFPRGSRGRAAPGLAGQAERSCVPAHSIASRSGSSSLATQTEPQHGPRRQIASQPGAKALAWSPVCPRGPGRLAGASALLCLGKAP